MKKPPSIIKKELIGLRRTLRGAEKRYEDAEVEFKRTKRGSNIAAQFDAEMKSQSILREIEQIKRAIRSAEEELVGDWKPRDWVEG